MQELNCQVAMKLYTMGRNAEINNNKKWIGLQHYVFI